MRLILCWSVQQAELLALAVRVGAINDAWMSLKPGRHGSTKVLVGGFVLAEMTMRQRRNLVVPSVSRTYLPALPPPNLETASAMT